MFMYIVLCMCTEIGWLNTCRSFSNSPSLGVASPGILATVTLKVFQLRISEMFRPDDWSVTRSRERRDQIREAAKSYRSPSLWRLLHFIHGGIGRNISTYSIQMTSQYGMHPDMDRQNACKDFKPVSCCMAPFQRVHPSPKSWLVAARSGILFFLPPAWHDLWPNLFRIYPFAPGFTVEFSTKLCGDFFACFPAEPEESEVANLGYPAIPASCPVMLGCTRHRQIWELWKAEAGESTTCAKRHLEKVCKQLNWMDLMDVCLTQVLTVSVYDDRRGWIRK